MAEIEVPITSTETVMCVIRVRVMAHPSMPQVVVAKQPMARVG